MPELINLVLDDVLDLCSESIPSRFRVLRNLPEGTHQPSVPEPPRGRFPCEFHPWQLHPGNVVKLVIILAIEVAPESELAIEIAMNTRK